MTRAPTSTLSNSSTWTRMPSYLHGSIGIPAQYVTVSGDVASMPVSVLRQPTLKRAEISSDVNKFKNATLQAAQIRRAATDLR
jgi:hypothetical protein